VKSERRTAVMADTEERKIQSWRELFEKTMEIGLGAALLTKESATKLADDLVKRGAVTRDESKKLVDDMLERGKGQKERMETFTAEVVERMLDRADLARKSTVDDLERRIASLESRLQQVGEEE
jgi:polyhydroxyalkanoate synthesis regulator phasin